MNRRKAIVYIFSITLLFIISFNIGYRRMNKQKHIDRVENIESDKKDKHSEDLNILNVEKRIGPNTVMEFRIHYKTCDDLIVDSVKASEKLINMNRQDYEEYLNQYFPNQKLISFSVEKIVIWEQKEQLCENHYVIGEKDGYIAIYSIDSNGEKILKNIFEEYPIDLLMEIDRNKLKTGIIVDSEDELSDVLENFIS